MNTLMWAAQWILALFLLVSFPAAPAGIRMGLARGRWRAAPAACFGLICALSLIVPWGTGQARLLTPIAASLVVLTLLLDALTNPMPPLDTFYLALCVVLGLVVAVGRFHSFGRRHGDLTSWALVLGGATLLVLCVLGNGQQAPKTRWIQAATGVAGVLGGMFGMMQPR